MFTGILRKEFKQEKVSVTSFSGGTSEKIIQNLDDLLKNKPDDMLIHVGTNDITIGVNLLNSVKKTAKQVSGISPRVKPPASQVLWP